jgi:predicted phosphodiesterase
MRYLVLTDIHANLEALDVCLADARARGYDETLVLGDLVGYGPDPNAVIDRVRDLNPAALVRGNHDKVACGLEQAEGFNTVAKSAAHWTLDVLTKPNLNWLAALPAGPHDVNETIQICHGAPFDEDAYIFDELDAVRALKLSTRPLCLFGHTHYPVTFELSDDAAGRRGLDADSDAERLEVPRQPRLDRAAARRRPACRVRDSRHVGATRRAVPLEVSGGRNAGEDRESRVTRSTCAETRCWEIGRTGGMGTKDGMEKPASR